MAADPLLLAPLDDLALWEETVCALRAKNALDQLLFRFTAELDKRGVAKTLGADSTAELLQSVQVPPAVAHRYVRVGRALSSIPSVAAYAVDGTLSGGHMDSIVKGVAYIERRDPDLTTEERDDCVRGLLTEASVSTPAEVIERAHAMAIALSPPDKEVPDSENDDLNQVSFNTGDDGRTHGTLDLDKALGEKLATALRPLAKPVPEPDGSPDPRTTPQRLAEALGKVLDTFFAHHDRPIEGGVKPRVTMTVSAAQLLQFQMNGIAGGKVPTAPATASFEWTGPVSPATAQTIACDAVITKILLDDNGVPLDWTVFIGGDEAQRSSISVADGHPWFIKPGSTTPLRSHARRTMTNELTAT
ncbi:DUF222 domain-containing protein [Williamsia soli]|uniref:DUF222 domain-containing protein n=1 Tax=Williamsia soli TaxID=364929 RepID=UPI001F24C6AD|nr:DUF222 domain-containing protein [Williamsia soli]